MFKKIALAVAVVTLSLPVAAQVTNAGESRVVTLEALGKLASIIDVCMQTPDCKERAAALVAQDVKAWNRVKGEFLSLDSEQPPCVPVVSAKPE